MAAKIAEIRSTNNFLFPETPGLLLKLKHYKDFRHSPYLWQDQIQLMPLTIPGPKTLMMLCYFSVYGIGFAQTKAPAAPAPAKESQKTLLWKVSGKYLAKPSYLFGTMHILCEQDAQLSENLRQVIKEAEQIYFEVDMDDTQQMMGALRHLSMKDGKRLSQLLSPGDYEKLKTYFENNKSMIPFQMMDRFKPYFISGMISERALACDKTNGMEMQIMAEAGQYEKEILGLETIEFQASIFDSIPYDKQARDLVTYIDSIDSYKSVMKAMADVYREQDLEKMESLMLKSDPGMEQYMDLLLYNRNRRWIDLMLSNMVEKTTLFAVGAGHLPGDQGVIELLRKRGYEVSPVKN